METTEKTTGLVTEEMGFRRIAMTKCLKSTHRNKEPQPNMPKHGFNTWLGESETFG
jgi:hypothetical protein